MPNNTSQYFHCEVPNAWGKANPNIGYHALEAHSVDVAMTFEALCGLPLITASLEKAATRTISKADIRRLGILVYLHDLGKLLPGFQAKARRDLACSADVNHSSAGMMLLGQAFAEPAHLLRAVPTAISSCGPAVEELMLAIFAHHGRPVTVPPKGAPPRPVPGYDMVGAAADYIAMLQRAFPDATADDSATQNLPDAPAFVHLVAGLTALADWIGSDQRFFPFTAKPGADYPDLARKAAQNALRTIGMDREGQMPATDFGSVAGGAFAPRPAQRLVGEADPLASALLLLEAETGSGKTEAAIWRYALLHAAGLVSGLYFAVPTRAAARQLHRRVNQSMQRLFGAEAPEAVLAIPGQLQSGEATGQRLPEFETRWDDADGPQPARWAAEHATRFLAAPIAVGTVDQAMLAGLQVKHAHLRAAALCRSLLVVDEVHASDVFMTEILARLVQDHLTIGGQAMLMSATLGSRARSHFLGTPQPDLAAAIATPYPALWSRGQGAPAHAPADGRQKAVQMSRLSSMDPTETAARAVTLAAQGARVLVIRNTVTAACDTFDAVIAAGGASLLMQAGGGPALHHSRFAAEDRALLDQAAESILAPDKNRTPAGAIIIGSQTLEQSLDICADYLITDLCPVDVLLQRLGRLHRHDLPRPQGFKVPRCLVLCPKDGLNPLTKPTFINGLGAWSPRDGSLQGIYLDLPCLSLTEGLIESSPIWRIPAMNRELVERATHPAARQAEIARRGLAWKDYETRTLGREASHGGQARQWILHRNERFPDRFPQPEESVKTRLGAQGPLLTFAPGTTGPFGSEITRITLPAHWAGLVIPEAPVTPEMTPLGLRMVLGDRKLHYTRSGLRLQETN